MTPSLEDIFAEAALLEGAARSEYLDRACGDDDDLRAEVQSLLDAEERRGDFLAKPSREALVPAGGYLKVDLQRGDWIDRYKLLEPIGEGGFGVVWMAEQREPVQRRVALKIIKLGMDTEQVVARFEAERQALAVLDHPYIAKVLDAGSTDKGRPYFVMEYIRGVPILEYCDRERVSAEERLHLFLEICGAVQHSHQKGIIHRDIKPSNILVTLRDGKPVPKIIDFGIAKATHSELTTKTLFTAHRQLVGTPAYMSPEQAEPGGMDIDTRADVYSLGVLLYEMLTGTTPFPTHELLDKGFLEIMRVIRDEDPPRPSTRVSTITAEVSSAAANRRIEPRKLQSFLSGDLDWIIMKALAKDRQRRYSAASSLADDVRRFLLGEPVDAAPPSASYRLRKALRRHKALVSATAAVTLSLLAGVLAFSWQARVARQERNLARDERNRALAAEQEIQRQADDLLMISQFHSRTLTGIDLIEVGRQLTDDVLARFSSALDRMGVGEAEQGTQLAAFRALWNHVNATDAAIGVIDRAVLAPSVDLLEHRFPRRPLIDATLRSALADRYRIFNLYDEALVLQREAHRKYQESLGDDAPETLEAHVLIGHLLQYMGRTIEAEEILLRVAERREAALGPDHMDTLRSLGGLGDFYWALGRYSEAETHWLECLARRRRTLGEEHPHTCLVAVSLAQLYRERRRPADAEPLLRRALEARRSQLGDGHSTTILTLAWLGATLGDLGKTAEGKRYLDEALEHYRVGLARTRDGTQAPRGEAAEKNVGSGTPFNSSGGLSSRLARLFEESGDFARAETYWRDAVEMARRFLGEGHHVTVGTTVQLGENLIAQGRLEDAETLLLDTLETAQRKLPAASPTARLAMRVLGDLYRTQGQPVQAEAYYLPVVSLDAELTSGDLPGVATTSAALAIVQQQQGRSAEARTRFDEAIAVHRRLAPGGSKALAQVLWWSGRSHMEEGSPEEAQSDLEEAVRIAESLLTSGHPDLNDYRASLAACERTRERDE